MAMVDDRDVELRKIEALFSQGQAGEALELLKAFLTANPTSLRGLNDLGTMLQNTGDGAGAEAAFRRALDLAPGHHETRVNLALSLGAQNKWPEAKAQVEKLLVTNQADARLWALLARAERGLGNLKTALGYIDRSLTIDPDQPQLKEARAKLAGEEDKPPIPSGKKPGLVMCCQKSLETFALALCDELDKYATINRVVADNFGPVQWPIQTAGTVWLEWAAEMSAEITHMSGLLDGKKVILRLHSFEILGDLAGRVDYSKVTDLVFVSRYMRDLFLRRFPGRVAGQRVHVIHNGLNLGRFPFKAGRGRRKIAFIGKLDAKKDPTLMVQAFAFLLKRHPDLELHVAGGPDTNRYYLTLPDFLRKNPEVNQAATFYGHVKDSPAWLADKDYILCTSPFESQGVGILEAVHSGLRPLIYSFPGAERLYPDSWLWTSLDQLETLLENGPDPSEASRFVAEKYSMSRQALNFLQVITGTEPVVEDDPVIPTGVDD